MVSEQVEEKAIPPPAFQQHAERRGSCWAAADIPTTLKETLSTFPVSSAGAGNNSHMPWAHKHSPHQQILMNMLPLAQPLTFLASMVANTASVSLNQTENELLRLRALRGRVFHNSNQCGCKATSNGLSSATWKSS